MIGAGAVLADGLTVGDRVRIGANATVAGALAIADDAVVEAGAVVTRDVPPYAIVSGNPARIVGYVNAGPAVEVPREAAGKLAAVQPTGVSGVTIHNLPVFVDLRGSLSVGEVERDLPFTPKRYFLVFDVPGAEVRGEHAHLECHQFLICVRGSCAVVADDGTRREEILLDRPNKGLHLPPMTWGIQYRYTEDAVLLVLASHNYAADDYIRSYDEFLARIRRAFQPVS